MRLDSDGDLLLCGPAVRAVARASERVVLLASPAGEQAAGLLPGVDDVLVFDAPWSGYVPPALTPGAFHAAVAALAEVGAARAVVLTSYHQSCLPSALLLRLAGIPWIAGASEDYPGALLDVRVRLAHADDPAAGGLHEVRRALAIAAAAGFDGDADPFGDALAVRPEVLAGAGPVAAPGYVVVHPGASVPARSPAPDVARSWVRALAEAGHVVVVTGSPDESALTRHVAGDHGIDLGGRTSYPELAGVLARACAVVVGNTGPAHLAAAVRTPVVSAFSPVVPWSAWRPWAVPVVRLGHQDQPCRDTRSRVCPVPGHPCLDSISGAEVVAAVAQLAAEAAA